MPKEQINTPSTRLVQKIEEKEGTAWGIRFMQDGEDYPTDGNTHAEHSPVLYVGWHKQGTEALPDECVTINIEVADE